MRVSWGKLLFSFFLLGVGFVGFCSSPAFAGVPVATQSSLLASPTSIPADGVTQTTITVTLKDASGTPLTGDSVQISVPTDLTANFNPSTVVLDVNGQGVFTMTSTQVGTDSINVTDSASGGTTLFALGQVLVGITPTSSPSTNSNSGTGGPSCNNQYPPGAPNLYAVFKNSNHTSVTLYFVPPSLPYDGFTVSYGLNASADTYAISFSHGQSTGAIKYTINSLIKDAPYYFKVRANNGCAAGPWSNAKSSTAAVSSLPKTGPENLFLEVGIAGALTVIAGMAFFFVF